jgi:dipeptidyl aminopeptidase/acylaminoacyl peptidase
MRILPVIKIRRKLNVTLSKRLEANMEKLFRISRMKLCALGLLTFFMPSISLGQQDNYRVDWSNKITLPLANIDYVDLSSDGRKVAFTRLQDVTDYGDNGELWIGESNGLNLKAFLQNKDFGGSKISISSPKFSPNGARIAFTNEHGMRLYIAEIANKEYYDLLEKQIEKQSPIWSIDGQKIFFFWDNSETGRGTYWVPAETKTIGAPTRFGATEFKLNSISNDGKNYFARKRQVLLIIDENGNLKETRTINTPLKGFSQPVCVPNKNYVILGNLLYDLQTRQEIKFLPDEIVTMQQAGKPNLVGPKSLSISNDGRKVAFVIDCDCKDYTGKAIVLDLVWK